jgi:hypothetical protein
MRPTTFKKHFRTQTTVDKPELTPGLPRLMEHFDIKRLCVCLMYDCYVSTVELVSFHDRVGSPVGPNLPESDID